MMGKSNHYLFDKAHPTPPGKKQKKTSVSQKKQTFSIDMCPGLDLPERVFQRSAVAGKHRPA
jgi:hypothetical protein